jgi:hypothetical protein
MKHVLHIKALFFTGFALASVSARVCRASEEQPLPAIYNVTVSFRPDAPVDKIVLSMPYYDDKPFVAYVSRDPAFVGLLKRAYKRVVELKPLIDENRKKWNQAKTQETNIEMQTYSYRRGGKSKK